MKKISEKGITLLLTILLIGVMLAAVLAAVVLALRESRITTLVDDSVQAYFASETGIERALYEARSVTSVDDITTSGSVSGGATWKLVAQEGPQTSGYDIVGDLEKEGVLELFPKESSGPSVVRYFTIAEWETKTQDFDPQKPILEITHIYWPKKNLSNPQIESDYATDSILKYGDIASGNIDVEKQTYTLADLTNSPPKTFSFNRDGLDYKVRLRAMQVGASFRLAPDYQRRDRGRPWSRNITLKSFGLYHNANSGITTTFFRPKEAPINRAFDFTIFSGQDIQAH